MCVCYDMFGVCVCACYDMFGVHPKEVVINSYNSGVIEEVTV